MAYSKTGYNLQSAVKLRFPALPRIGDYIHLPENKEVELVRNALKNRETLNEYACWVVGQDTEKKVLNLEELHIVRDIDWMPLHDYDDSVECYISLDNHSVNGGYLSDVHHEMYHNGPFSEEEFQQIRRNTFEVYGIGETDNNTKQTHA